MLNYSIQPANSSSHLNSNSKIINTDNLVGLVSNKIFNYEQYPLNKNFPATRGVDPFAQYIFSEEDINDLINGENPYASSISHSPLEPNYKFSSPFSSPITHLAMYLADIGNYVRNLVIQKTGNLVNSTGNFANSILPKVLSVTAKQLSNKNDYETYETQQEQERPNSDDILERNKRSVPNTEDNIFVSLEYNGGKTKGAGRNDDTYYHLTTKAKEANYRYLIDESDSMSLSDLNTTRLVEFMNRANEKSRDQSWNLGKCGIFRLFGLFDVKHYSCGKYPMFDNTENAQETRIRNGAIEIVFNVMRAGTENYNNIHASLDFPSAQSLEQAFYRETIIKKVLQEAKKYGTKTEDIVGSVIVLVAKDAKLHRLNKTIDEIELAKSGQSFPILAALCNNPNWLPSSYTTESIVELKFWAEMNCQEKYNYKIEFSEGNRRGFTRAQTYVFPAIFTKDMLDNPFYPQPRGITNTTKALLESLKSLDSCYISSEQANADIHINYPDNSLETGGGAVLTITDKKKYNYTERNSTIITSCRAHPNIAKSGPTYIIEDNFLGEVRDNVFHVVEKLRQFIRGCALDSGTNNPSRLELELRRHRGLRDDISWTSVIDRSSFNDINSTKCYAEPVTSEMSRTMRQDHSSVELMSSIIYINGEVTRRIPKALLYSRSLHLSNCITENNITRPYLESLQNSQGQQYIDKRVRKQFSLILKRQQEQTAHHNGIFIVWRADDTHDSCFIADNNPFYWKECFKILNQRYIERYGNHPVKPVELYYRASQKDGTISLEDLEIDDLNRVLAVKPGSLRDLIYPFIVEGVNQYKHIKLVTCTIQYTASINIKQKEIIQGTGFLCGNEYATTAGTEGIITARLIELLKDKEAGKAAITSHNGALGRAEVYDGLQIIANPPEVSFTKVKKAQLVNNTIDAQFEYNSNSQTLIVTITPLDIPTPYFTFEANEKIIAYIFQGENVECFEGHHGTNVFLHCPRYKHDEKPIVLDYKPLEGEECLNMTRAMAQTMQRCRNPRTAIVDVQQLEGVNNIPSI